MGRQAQLINLWKQCFEDSDAFLRLFFERVYRKENVLTLEREGEIVSALYLLPYPMNYYGKTISVDYIYAVGTSTAWRNRGLMRELFGKACRAMQRRQTALAVLIPAEEWLFHYYGSLGFVPAFDYQKRLFTSGKPCAQSLPDPSPFPEEELYAYFQRKMGERSCCILHTADDFHTLLADLHLGGGTLLTHCLPETRSLTGLAMLYPQGDGWLVKELLYDNEKVKEQLLEQALAYTHRDTVAYLTPATGHTDSCHTLGMAQIIDREALLGHWLSLHPDEGYTPEQLRELDGNILTRLLLGTATHDAYMSLMLD